MTKNVPGIDVGDVYPTTNPGFRHKPQHISRLVRASDLRARPVASTQAAEAQATVRRVCLRGRRGVWQPVLPLVSCYRLLRAGLSLCGIGDQSGHPEGILGEQTELPCDDGL